MKRRVLISLHSIGDAFNFLSCLYAMTASPFIVTTISLHLCPLFCILSFSLCP
ncbi:hypothetical protein BKA57DRAFT_479284 [Linnemannia elongata]|nr:hypothetical protein BKA57DRAFT_479284 [Linnemannia elongata]